MAGQPVRVTGFDALAKDSGDSDGPGVLVEALIGGFGALLVLIFVFASVLAVVPLLVLGAELVRRDARRARAVSPWFRSTAGRQAPQ